MGVASGKGNTWDREVGGLGGTNYRCTRLSDIYYFQDGHFVGDDDMFSGVVTRAPKIYAYPGACGYVM